MELVIEAGNAPMPRSRPVKRLSEGEPTELRTQLVDCVPKAKKITGSGDSDPSRRKLATPCFN